MYAYFMSGLSTALLTLAGLLGSPVARESEIPAQGSIDGRESSRDVAPTSLAEVIRRADRLRQTVQELVPVAKLLQQADCAPDKERRAQVDETILPSPSYLDHPPQFIPSQPGYRYVKEEAPAEKKEQIQLRITVAEVNRTAARQIGIYWTIKNKAGVTVFPQKNAGNLGSTTGNGVNTTIAQSVDEPVQLDESRIALALQALRKVNLARTLVEPNLTVLNGHTAIFRAGGEFPVPIVADATLAGPQGNPYGVQLELTPVITDKNHIRLQINAQISVKDATGISSCSITTTVELRQRQTLAIDGLPQTKLNSELLRVLEISDIPLIGALVGRSHTNSCERELVLLVTSELVHPMEAKESEEPPVRLTKKATQRKCCENPPKCASDAGPAEDKPVVKTLNITDVGETALKLCFDGGEFAGRSVLNYVVPALNEFLKKDAAAQPHMYGYGTVISTSPVIVTPNMTWAVPPYPFPGVPPAYPYPGYPVYPGYPYPYPVPPPSPLSGQAWSFHYMATQMLVSAGSPLTKALWCDNYFWPKCPWTVGYPYPGYPNPGYPYPVQGQGFDYPGGY